MTRENEVFQFFVRLGIEPCFDLSVVVKTQHSRFDSFTCKTENGFGSCPFLSHQFETLGQKKSCFVEVGSSVYRLVGHDSINTLSFAKNAPSTALSEANWFGTGNRLRFGLVPCLNTYNGQSEIVQ